MKKPEENMVKSGNVNIKDIARYAGVSVTTVSRVMNGQHYIREETRERVLAVMEKYHYIPNNSARNLKREGRKGIGVVVKGFSNPFFIQILEVVQKTLAERGYETLLHPIDTQADEVDAAAAFVKEKKPQGLLFLGGNFVHRKEKLDLLSVPYVMLAMMMDPTAVEDSRYSSVSIDDYKEVYTLGKQILQAGHKHVAVMGTKEKDTSVSGLRIKAFREAFEESGITPQVILAEGYGREWGYQTAKAFFSQTSQLPSCLFCIADILALGALRAAYEAGLHVPKDLSLIGFDGIEAASFAVPSLATVRQPGAEMAEKGVEILLECIEKNGENRHIVCQACFEPGESFVEKDSCH